VLFGAAVPQCVALFAKTIHGKGWAGAQQAPADEGAQDTAAQICLYLGHSGLIDSSLIDSTGRLKNDARW
jgi:hypothetical protein